MVNDKKPSQINVSPLLTDLQAGSQQFLNGRLAVFFIFAIGGKSHENQQWKYCLYIQSLIKAYSSVPWSSIGVINYLKLLMTRHLYIKHCVKNDARDGVIFITLHSCL